MEHTTIAVDLAKSVFQIAVSHQPGRVDEERRLSRDRFLEFFAQRPRQPCSWKPVGPRTIGRQLQPFGTRCAFWPARCTPYVRRNKIDRTDAKGCWRLIGTRRFIPSPSRASPTKPSRRCIASGPPGSRPNGATQHDSWPTAEFGIFIPVGAHHVVPAVRTRLAEPTPCRCSCIRRSPRRVID